LAPARRERRGLRRDEAARNLAIPRDDWRTRSTDPVALRCEAMSDPNQLFDLKLLAQRRDRAAADAAAHDFLLQRVAEDFMVRLGAVQRQFPIAVDLGAHHGVLGR